MTLGGVLVKKYTPTHLRRIMSPKSRRKKMRDRVSVAQWFEELFSVGYFFGAPMSGSSTPVSYACFVVLSRMMRSIIASAAAPWCTMAKKRSRSTPICGRQARPKSIAAATTQATRTACACAGTNSCRAITGSSRTLSQPRDSCAWRAWAAWSAAPLPHASCTAGSSRRSRRGPTPSWRAMASATGGCELNRTSLK